MLKLWKRHKLKAFLGIFFIFVSSATMIGMEFLKARLIDSAVEKNLQSLIYAAIILFIMVIIKAYTHYIYSRNFFGFRVDTASDLREFIFDSVLSRTYPEFLKRKSGEYLSIYTNQLSDVENSYFNSLYGLFQILTELIMSMIFLTFISPQLSIASFLSLIPALLIPFLVMKIMSRAKQEYIDSVSDNLGKLKEWLIGFETIISFNSASRFLKLFDKSIDDIKDKSERMGVLTALSMSLSSILVRLSGLVIIVIAALQVAKGKISIGLFVAAVGIMDQMTTQIVHISKYVKELMVVRVPINSIFKLIDEKISSDQKTETIENVTSIDYDDMSFRHFESDRNLFKDFNLHIKEHGVYEIMGESGSGKSTLMSILFGYYEPNCGEVLINKIPVSKISNLTDIITVMRQEAIFFDDSLRNNLTMYRDISDEIIIDMMKSLGLDKYANQASLDRNLINAHELFSGGEARRLMVIRSILKDSEILILDEPLANVDTESMQKIENLIENIKDKYVFVITHKPLDKKDQSIYIK